MKSEATQEDSSSMSVHSYDFDGCTNVWEFAPKDCQNYTSWLDEMLKKYIDGTGIFEGLQLIFSGINDAVVNNNPVLIGSNRQSDAIDDRLKDHKNQPLGAAKTLAHIVDFMKSKRLSTHNTQQEILKELKENRLEHC